MDQGYPRSIASFWKGVPDNFDTVLSASNGYTYFFKDDLIYRFNHTAEQVDIGYPKSIALWRGILYQPWLTKIIHRWNEPLNTRINTRCSCNFLVSALPDKILFWWRRNWFWLVADYVVVSLRTSLSLGFQEKVSFKFPDISSVDWNSILQNLRKRVRGQPCKGISVSFDFPSENSGIFGWMFRFSEIQQCPDFLETFPGKFCTICLCFETGSCGMSWSLFQVIFREKNFGSKIVTKKYTVVSNQILF